MTDFQAERRRPFLIASDADPNELVPRRVAHEEVLLKLRDWANEQRQLAIGENRSQFGNPTFRDAGLRAATAMADAFYTQVAATAVGYLKATREQPLPLEGDESA